MSDKIRSVELFSGTLWETELLKSVLEDEHIEAFLKDEIIGTILPWHASPGGANPIKVIVSSNDFEKASQVLSRFLENQKQ
ncbi:MAG: DUF2007 domain-containing protein [Bacteroidales bacterium]|nr:DUF2007 domain-containing protein [Bacteroidales bacterium]